MAPPLLLRFMEQGLKQFLSAEFMIPPAPKPLPQVNAFLKQLGLKDQDVAETWQAFFKLKTKHNKLFSDERKIPMIGILTMLDDRPRWVVKILRSLVELGGCYECVTWQEFLYIFVQFGSLTKVEICQMMFYIIIREVKSWTLHFITASQLDLFYSYYSKCEDQAFNTSHLNILGLPKKRYYLRDFVDLCHQYNVLVAPALHLQHSIRKIVPGVEFWQAYHRPQALNDRLVDLEFFKYLKSTDEEHMDDEEDPALLYDEPDSDEELEPPSPDALEEFEPLRTMPGQLDQKTVGKRLQKKWKAKEKLLQVEIPEVVKIPRTFGDFQRDRKKLPEWLVHYIDVPEGKGVWQRVAEMAVIRQSRDRTIPTQSLLSELQRKHQRPLLKYPATKTNEIRHYFNTGKFLNQNSYKHGREF